MGSRPTLSAAGAIDVGPANITARVIALSAIIRRCQLADRLGADVVINSEETDPVAAVTKLTDGGADVVIEAVDCPAGLVAFDQLQRMGATAD